MALSTAAPPGTVSDAANSRLPAWILLDQEAYIDFEDRENATTAVARTGSGRSVKVTFFSADPPRLSHFSVHCPGLTEKFDFLGRPRILYSVDNLALISVCFARDMKTEYFFYRAGRGRRPSLEHLPDIGSYLSEVPFVASVGIMPCGGDGDDFILAALRSTLVGRRYELHVFKSEPGTWTSNVLVLGSHRLGNIEKVITLGGGQLGFVNLRKGVLICDVLADNPMIRFIPLPQLLPNNQSDDQVCPARLFRDVVCCDGLIKCVEVEACSQRIPRNPNKHRVSAVPGDLSNIDVLHDSDLLDRAADKDVIEEEDSYEYLGWRVISWARELSSTCWHKEYLFRVDDIRVNNTLHIALLDELAPSLTLKDMFVSVPSVSMDDSNALYLICKVDPRSQEFCVLMVDIEKKTVEELSPILTQGPNCRSTYIPCRLSKYLIVDSDGTQIGGENVSWSASTSTQPIEERKPTEGFVNQCITPRDHYPHAHYSDFHRQRQPQEVVHPLWQHSPPIQESFGQNYGDYHYFSPISPSEMYYHFGPQSPAPQPTHARLKQNYGDYHCGPPIITSSETYSNHQQQQQPQAVPHHFGLTLLLSRSSSPAPQPSQESFRPNCGDYHCNWQQKPQAVASPLLQQSPLRSSSSSRKEQPLRAGAYPFVPHRSDVHRQNGCLSTSSILQSTQERATLDGLSFSTFRG